MNCFNEVYSVFPLEIPKVDNLYSQHVVYRPGVTAVIMYYSTSQLCDLEPRPTIPTRHGHGPRASLDLFTVGPSVCFDI